MLLVATLGCTAGRNQDAKAGAESDAVNEKTAKEELPANQEPDEPGRDAIDRALSQLYPTERDHRFGILPEPGEKEAPLVEVVAFRATEPVPHWHYVTYGLSELGEKQSEDSDRSGFGVEYTLRLVDDAEQPPPWPINLLRYIATLVISTREPPDPNHSMDLPEGLLKGVSPGVEGLAFLADPDLGEIGTPNGHLTFVNVLPLADREWWLLGAWDFNKYIGAVREQQGDLLWRVDRASVLIGDRGRDIEARALRDGSSQSVDYCEIQATSDGIVLDDLSRKVVVKFMRYRLAFGREAKIVGGTLRVRIFPADAWSMECSAEACEVGMPKHEAVAFADTLEAAGEGSTFSRPGNTRFRVTTGLPPVKTDGESPLSR